ncbi:MAG: hypothetical protein C0408_00980 [Odoribacter sp.]|nr:hypothetical protein [Odoribacter sp.]
MNKSGNKFIFAFSLFLVLSSSPAFPQNQPSKPTRQSALDAFSKGNYELAYIQFNELSANFPRDPIYKYYCGILLVKLERDPVNASSLLKEALQGSAAIRTIPSDGLFYLGRAHQLSGNFSEAIKSYNLYTELVGKKNAKENLTSQFIQQCNERKGELVLSGATEKEVIKKSAELELKNEKAILTGKTETYNPETIVREENSMPEEYRKKLNDVLNYQFAADSLMKLADLCRKQLQYASVSEKPALKSKISEIEQLAGDFQKRAKEEILAAGNATKSKTGQEAFPDEIVRSDSSRAKIETVTEVIRYGDGIMKDTLIEKKGETFPKIITQKTNNQIFKDTVNQLVTKENIVLPQQKPMELYSVFEVVTKPVSAANEKVPVNAEVPSGLIYRIQVAVFSNPVAPTYFKGITPVYGFKNDGSDLTKYYAGMFRKSADASHALVKVKGAGFKDSFVVALFDKKVVSAERAAILEKEWGNKPFIIAMKKIQDLPGDTIPPTLLFRVEVIKSAKPVNSEQLDNIKRLAGNRGLDILKNESGQIIYLVGKFLNFESAAEYSDLLTRNGQKEAKVTAYLGKREIPVETAKQLFERF